MSICFSCLTPLAALHSGFSLGNRVLLLLMLLLLLSMRYAALRHVVLVTVLRIWVMSRLGTVAYSSLVCLGVVVEYR